MLGKHSIDPLAPSARTSCARGLLGLLLAGFCSVSLATETMIENIRLSVEGNKSRLVLDLSSIVNYRLFSLTKPDRIVLDIQNARLNGTPDNINFAGSLVRKLRFGEQNNSTLRMVVEVDHNPQASGFLLPAANGVGPRLVVDLYSGAPDTGVVAGNPQPVTQPPVPAIKAVPIPTPLVEIPVAAIAAAPIAAPKPAPAKTLAPSVVPPSAVTQAATLKPVMTADNQPGRGRDVVIAIDAGHGGKDPGAIGHYNTQEKDVVLAIARRLNTLLDQEPGVKAVLTRSGDQFLTLRDRVLKARQYKADLFISIHADSSEDERIRGSSVYMLSQHGASSEAARWLAARENSADPVGGVRLDDKDPLLASVLLDLSQSATSEASLNLATNVLQSLKQAGRIRSYKVEKAGFVVLKSPDIPSILVETAYVSNIDEEQLLSDVNSQQMIAGAIMQGLRGYLRDHAPPGTAVSEHNRGHHSTVSSSTESTESYQVNSIGSTRDSRSPN